MKKKKGLSLEKKQGMYGYLFILPLIIGAVFLFYPNIIKTFIFSLNEINIEKGGYSLAFQGFKYYKDAFTSDPDFIRLFVGSLMGLITDVPIILIFSLLISTLLNQKFFGRTAARIIFFIPVLLMSGIIGQIENSTNFINMVESGRTLESGLQSVSQLGLITKAVSSIGFGNDLVQIAVKAAQGVYGVVQRSGIQIFVFLAALQEIPISIYEAAKVEGCHAWQIFWKITIPMIAPQILVNAVYTVVDIFTNPSNEMFKFLKDMAFIQNQYGYSTAMSFTYLIAVGLILGLAGLIIVKFVKKSLGR